MLTTTMLSYKLNERSNSENLRHFLDASIYLPIELIVQKKSSFFIDGVYPIDSSNFISQMSICIHTIIHTLCNHFYKTACSVIVRNFFHYTIFLEQRGIYLLKCMMDIFDVGKHRKHIKCLTNISFYTTTYMEIIQIPFLFFLLRSNRSNNIFEMFSGVDFLCQKTHLWVKLNSKDISVF